MARAMIFSVVLILFFLTACRQNEPSGSQVSELKNELETSIREARQLFEQKLGPLKDDVQNRTSEEFKKLHAVEYRVVAYPLGVAPATLEEALGKLGEQRWDCFHIQQTPQGITVFCKRRPESYLRYVTKFSGW